MTKRNYSRSTINKLFAKSAGQCSFPNCGMDLVENDVEFPSSNICHIISETGPRSQQIDGILLNTYENLILLCPNHHNVVDRNQIFYTVEKLKSFKLKHEQNVMEKLKSGSIFKYNISQIDYLNIPRLSLLVNFKNSKSYLSLPHADPPLSKHGIYLIQIMHYFDSLLNHLTIKAVPLSSFEIINNSISGKLVSLNKTFYTNSTTRRIKKNIFPNIGEQNPNIQYIWCKVKDYKLLISIDTNWITTVSAFENFRARIFKFSGLCIIKNVDVKEKLLDNK